jgi:hypothetical protein
MDKDFLKRIEELEGEVSRLKREFGQGNKEKPFGGVLKFDFTLPRAELGGLRFNETKIRAVFDLKEDGWWHSRDVLFMSARNVTDDTNRDILTTYLESYGFRQNIGTGLLDSPHKSLIYEIARDIGGFVCNLEVSLPYVNKGEKKYNGTDIWYWLKPAAEASSFCIVYSGGFIGDSGASSVGGCAPMFRLKEGKDD